MQFRPFAGESACGEERLPGGVHAVATICGWERLRGGAPAGESLLGGMLIQVDGE
jgi:hypothetical protein